MNSPLKIIKLGLTITLFGLAVAMPILAAMPGDSHAFGKTAAAWNETYWRWVFGELTFPIDGNGNAVVPPHVVLMSYPDTPGNGTPGHLDVTLNAGQAFVLPLWHALGATYTDGTPPDPLEDVNVFRTLNITFKIDGVTVIDTSNVLNFYSEFFFHPPIPIDFPPANSIIWDQGVSIVQQPLSVGTHTLSLDAVNTQPASFGFAEYHNTWTVTVQPGR